MNSLRNKISNEIKRIKKAITSNTKLTYTNISKLKNHIGILKDILRQETIF